MDTKARTVSLLLDGEKVAKAWNVEPDAEVKIAAWWGRLDQLKAGEKVWVWLKLDRDKNPISVAMIADELSSADIRYDALAKAKPDAPLHPGDKLAAAVPLQKEWLRKKWVAEGLPGTLGFVHNFSGELDLLLDHEAMRWGRSLKPGDAVELQGEKPIQAVVKSVKPWRERTQLRLVVGELQASELKSGQRLQLKMT